MQLETGNMSKIAVHESTQIQLDVCVVYEQWKLHGTIYADMERDACNGANL